MAGGAVSSKFMLGSATLMLGAMADLPNFLPSTHSVGLCKNLQITAQPQSVDLTEGVLNSLVYSVVTTADPRVQGEVYEYTSKNLAYALGIDGSSGFTPNTVSTTVSAAVSGKTTPTASVPVTSATGIVANDYVMLSDPDAGDDAAIVRKVTDVVTNTLTVSPDIGVDLGANTVVKKINIVNAGRPTNGLFLAARVVGIIADGSVCQIDFPKIRITNGFALGFQVNDYGNLPFEFKTFDLLPADSNYAEYGQGVKARIGLVT